MTHITGLMTLCVKRSYFLQNGQQAAKGGGNSSGFREHESLFRCEPYSCPKQKTVKVGRQL